MQNQYHWSLEDPVMSIIAHHGIKGQKWGVRRFQNEDGSLTAEGRKRLGLDTQAPKEWGQDYVIKKGTKTTRVVKADFYYDDDDNITYDFDRVNKNEKEHNTKYMSVDNVRNSGREHGGAFYLDWFGDHGYEFDQVRIDEYETKKDIKVASGEKVLKEVLKHYGDKDLEEMYNSVIESEGSFFKKADPESTNAIAKRLNSVTMAYTNNKELFDDVNKTLKKMGYDAAEDINDRRTDMPIIVFDSKGTTKRTKQYTADEYYNKLVKDGVVPA